MAEEKEEGNAALKWFLNWSKKNNLALSSKVNTTIFLVSAWSVK